MNTYSAKAAGGFLTALLISLFIHPVAAAASGYYTQAGKIYDPASREVQLRGLNHFGFNTETLLPHYLWQMGWKEQIAQIKSLGFNAVRLPFAPDTLYNTTPVDKQPNQHVDPNKNPELIGKTPLQALDLWMAEMDRQGLYVLLDFHSVTKYHLYPTWFIDNPADFHLTYNKQAYPVSSWHRDLAFVAQRYAHLPHFIAIDLFNEPNGPVRWSSGDPNSSDPKHFWKAAAEGAAAAVLQANPNILVFVEGTNANYDGVENSGITTNWGENFQPQAYKPLNIPSDKLVLSPHTYGPDVYGKPSFDAWNYPANLAADWETLFGQFSPKHAVVLGEWGGRYGQGGTGHKDVQWQNALVDYLLSKGMTSSFYWTYMPNSSDTGGILDDNMNVREDKMALLRRLWGAAPTGTGTPQSTPGGGSSLPPSSDASYAVGGALGEGLLLLLTGALVWRLALRKRLNGRIAQRLARQKKKLTGNFTAAIALGLIIPSANAAMAGYYTQAGKIYNASGHEIQLRGLNHFGFNTETLLPHYLWQMGWKEQIAQIKNLGFNAVRLPFAPETLYNTTPVDKQPNQYVDPNKNPELIGKTPLQALDLWMAEMDRQGLYVLLDFHSVTKYHLYPTWFVDNPADFHLTYNKQAYPVSSWHRDLAFVARRYAHLPHFIAIDLFNEPNGAARWGSNNGAKFSWKAAAEGAASAVLQANPNLLIFVEGSTANHDGIENSSITMNWGENFQPQKYQPLSIPGDKLVLSPHTYGPDVYMKPSFNASNYPANLAADWETLFGQFAPQHTVVLGEWGGRYGQGGTGQKDVQWQNALVDYLISKNIRSSFYWTYMPNSSDTGGILDDNMNVRQDKMALLKRYWGAAPSSSSAPQPQTGTFSAAFSPSPNINEWWVEVHVESPRTLGSVHAQVNGGSWTLLPKTDWASWAESFYVPKGSSVVFRATATDGSTATSGRYAWMQSDPQTAPAPAPAPTPAPAPAPVPAPAPAEPGTLTMSATSYAVAQNAGSITITVNRVSGATGAVSAKIATGDGSALSGRDYTGRSDVLKWAAGDTTAKSFVIAISNSTPRSGRRSFKVRLTNATGGAIISSPNYATVTINGSKR